MADPIEKGKSGNGGTERGFATAQFMVVAAVSMLFLALLVNLIAIQYAQGVVRAALDEGVRIGAAAPATEIECLEAISRVVEDLMSGPLGDGLQFRCAIAGSEIVAGADAVFAVWFPGLPDMRFGAEVRAVKESDE